MIDQVLKEIGIEGGSLSKMPGLMREARDMQRSPRKPTPAAQGKAGERHLAPARVPERRRQGRIAAAQESA